MSIDPVPTARARAAGAAPRRVLVLGGEHPAALAVARSLARRGLHCEVGAAAPRSLAARSRACASSFVYPDPLRDAAAYQRALLQRLKGTAYGLVVPVTEAAIVPLLAIRAEAESLAPLALAPSASIQLALSRRLLTELARELGIPLPRGAALTRLEEAETASAGLAFPLLVKPDRALSWSGAGLARRKRVALAAHAAELPERLAGALGAGPVLLEEHLPGEAVGLVVLAGAGRLLARFQYRCLRETGPPGGGVCARVSEPPDPQLLEQAAALVQRLAWDGVAQLEFRREPERGAPRLVALRGRFGSALPLAVAAGADFPAFLHAWLSEGRRSFPAEYRAGLRSRRLPGELGWLGQALRPGASQGFGGAGSPARGGALRAALSLLDPRARWDAFRLRDPWPALAELAGAATGVWRELRQRLLARRLRRRMHRLQRRPAALARRLRRAERLVVLCSGNLIRSPFAAEQLRRALGSEHRLGIDSAGIHAEPGEPADPRAVAIAARAGLDTRGHRSQRLTRELAAPGALLIAMDVAHLVSLHAQLPARVARRALLLGCFHRDGPLEIADPDGRGLPFYEARLAEVAAASAALAARLASTPGAPPRVAPGASAVRAPETPAPPASNAPPLTAQAPADAAQVGEAVVPGAAASAAPDEESAAAPAAPEAG